MSNLVIDAATTREGFLSIVGEGVADGNWSDISNACAAFLEQQADLKETSIYAEAYYVLAIGRFLEDDWAEAVALGEAALNADSNVSEYADFLAVLYALAGELTKSLFYAKLASSVPSVPALKEILPQSIPSLSSAFIDIEDNPLFTRAVAAVSSKDWGMAIHWFLQCIHFKQDDKKSYLGLVNCLTVLGRYQEAVDILRGAMHRLAEDPDIASMLGSLLALIGEYGQSQSVHKWAMHLDSENSEYFAKAISDLALSPESTEEALCELAAQWGARFGEEDQGFDEGQATDKPILTAGYLLGSLSRRSEGKALANILAHRNAARFRTVGFGFGALSDASNVHYQKAFDIWHDVREMDPVTLAAICLAEGVDIFINTVGFNDPQLLRAFGARMAPLQVSLHGTPYGTGLKNMDALMLGGEMVPENKSILAEKIVLLEHGNMLVEVPKPDDRSVLERTSDLLTFGVDAELCELTPDSVGLWAELLRKYPSATLLMQDYDFQNAKNAGKVLDLFGNFGVSHRIDIIQSATQSEFYSQIDLLLVPTSGHQNLSVVTSAGFGVPPICMKGSRTADKVSAEVLTQMGMSESCVATSRKDYLALVERWIKDEAGRAAFKQDAAEKISKAPLFDFKARCIDMETVLERLWKDVC